MRVRGEQGQVTVLILGLALVVFAVSGLAVDGTRAFLFRRTLQNSADAASLAAASELDEREFYASAGRVRALDADDAERAAHRWLSLRGLGARSDVRVEGDRVIIVLRDEVPTSFLALVGIDHIPVAVLAAAEPRA